MSGKSSVAEELSRSYHHVRRFLGPRVEVGGQAFVLSRPTFPDEHVGELAAVLYEGLPELNHLASLLGAREVREVTPGALGRGWYHLGQLENGPLVELVAEGVRPLRTLRRYDVVERVAELRRGLEAAQVPLAVDLETLGGRLVAIFGEETGREIVDAWEVAQLGDDTQSALLGNLCRAGHLLDRSEGAMDPEVRRYWLQLDALPREEPKRSRAVVGLFRGVVGEDASSAGRRRSLEARVRGLGFGPALETLVSELEVSSEAPAWTHAQRKILLELAIRFRGTALALPTAPDRVRQLRDAVQHIGMARVPELWPAFVELAPDTLKSMMWQVGRSPLPGAVLARAVRLGVVFELEEFTEVGRAKAYLDAVERLQENPIPHVAPSADWFVRPFRAGRAWEPGLALAMLSTHQDNPQALVAAFETARSTGFAEFGFADAIASWSEPTDVPRPPEFEAVCNALNLKNHDVDQYLHWRRLAHGDATFSTSLLAPLELAEKERRELDHLRSRPNPSPGVVARIEALESSERRAERFDAAVRQAQNSFERSLQTLRAESLNAVIEDTARAAFAQLLGRAVTGALPERLRSLILLLSADRVDLEKVRHLIEDLLDARDLAERPENARWLAKMRSAGVDVDRWMEGIEVDVLSGGQTLHFRTERDPLHVLEMGSYFKTCLSLDTGFNAGSTLTNAVDVNKQVIYGFRDDGTVAARKLLAVTDDGKLLGYRLYAFDERRSVAAELDQHLAEFAESCGLELGNAGEPTALHGTFWYDDGVEPWLGGSDSPIPPDGPADPGAIEEYAYLRGFDDPEAWRVMADTGSTIWANMCAARWVRAQPDMSKVPTKFVEDEETQIQLVAWGDFRWFAASDQPLAHLIGDLGAAIPADPDVVRRFCDAVRTTRGVPARWSTHLPLAPTALACLSVSEIAAYLVDHVRLARDAKPTCFDDPNDTCAVVLVERAADILTAAWLREGPGDVDRLFTARDDLLERIGCALATRVQDEALGRRVRQRFKQAGPDGLTEVALAVQGDDSSRWALESAVRAGAELQHLLDQDWDEVPEFASWEDDFQPAAMGALLMRRALFQPEPSDAILAYYASSTLRLQPLSMLAFWAPDERIAFANSQIDLVPSWMSRTLRVFSERLPLEVRLERPIDQDVYALSETLGVDPNTVRAFCLHSAESSNFETMCRVVLWAARTLDPPDFAVLLQDLVDTHAVDIVRDADAWKVWLRVEYWSSPTFRLAQALGEWLRDHPMELPIELGDEGRDVWFREQFVDV